MVVCFRGGAELLFKNIKEHELQLTDSHKCELLFIFVPSLLEELSVLYNKI